MDPKVWRDWQAAWRAVENQAARRGWEVTPLRVSPPASEAEVALFEAKHGLKVPPQLRELLTRYARQVDLGWRIPSHLQPLEKVHQPNVGGLRDQLWSLDHIDTYAIANFKGWRTHLAAKDISEEPNTPQMWENQFPFADLMNGDMLTIDVSGSSEPHPVRYFSHDLEGLHGRAIAPDFITFISVYTRLGCAGATHDDWFAFVEKLDDRRHYLSADGAAATRWLAWMRGDGGESDPDVPPPVVMARTPEDHTLLQAAAAGNVPAVEAALAVGARIDCVIEGNWSAEFVTSVTHAIRARNMPLLRALVAKGASLNTRRLALAEAVEHGTSEMVDWLIAHKARVHGWKHERHWPLHLTVVRRKLVDGAVDRDEVGYAILEKLLKAGAKPDVPWDNGITMLMWGDARAAALLLAHGADAGARDTHGQTAFHYVRSAEKVRVLARGGGDINALSTPPASEVYFGAVTPLQRALQAGRLLGRPGGRRADDLIPAMLELGADPKAKDGRGLSVLWYCHTVDDFKRMQSFGLAPFADKDAEGNTLLHRAANGTRIAHPAAIDFFKFLLQTGFSVNVTNAQGQTILHLLAGHEVTRPEDVQLALESGADKELRDKAGRAARDLVPASRTEIAALLR